MMKTLYSRLFGEKIFSLFVSIPCPTSLERQRRKLACFLEYTEAKSRQDQSAVFRQLQQWIASLPNYIKGLFGKLSCES